MKEQNKTYGRGSYGNAAANAVRTGGTTAVAAKTAGVRPVYDLVFKEIDSNGKTDPDAKYIKITGLFANETKSGEVYYSGSDKESGRKYCLFPSKPKDAQA